jgi:hypothetical protein
MEVSVIAESDTLKKSFICPECYSEYDATIFDQFGSSSVIIQLSPKTTEVIGSLAKFGITSGKQRLVRNFLTHYGEIQRRDVYPEPAK